MATFNMRLLVFVIVYAIQVAVAQEHFEITERHPVNLSPEDIPVHRVKEGESFTLSCTSSQKFNLCSWVHPGSQTACGIISGDERKRCIQTGAMSTWTVTREGDTKCKVVVEEMGPDEVGEWNCDLQSYPNQENKYDTAQEYTMIKLVRPAHVELKGPLDMVLYEGERAEFICQASGAPVPTVLEFSIGRAPLDGVRVEDESADTNKREMRVSAEVRKEWSGKQLTCAAKQTDDEGNEIEGTDMRNIKVEKERPRTRGVEHEPSGRSGEFTIFERYPQGAQGVEPTLVISKGVLVTFSCSSTLSWHICRWKRPNSQEPCGILSDTASKSCSVVWGTGTGNEWTARKISPTTCTLTGVIHDMDNGEWNCEMQSKPILNEDNLYKADQQYFTLSVIQKSRLKLDIPAEVELNVGEDLEIRIDVSNAFPLPEILFYLNTKEVKLDVISSSPPSQDGNGLYSFTQTVRYTADYEDTGKKLIFISRQTDDEGNDVEEVTETFLNVRAPLPKTGKASISGGTIGAIVGTLVFLLLILILVGMAFRGGWLCFARTPLPIVYKEAEKADTHEADIQTEGMPTSDSGNNAAFGPNKPIRSYDQFQGVGDDPDAPEFHPLLDGPNAFAQDGTRAYDDEGIGSKAGSIPSLIDSQSSIDERDWKDTLQVLGPKFAAMAEHMRGERDDDDDDDGKSSSSNDEDVEKGVDLNRKPDYTGGSEV